MRLTAVTGLQFAGLTLVIGALVFRWVVVARAALSSGDVAALARRVATRGAWGAAFVAVAAPLRAVVQAQGLGFPGEPLLPVVAFVLRETALGQILTIQCVAAVLGVIALMVARADASLGWLAALGATGVVVACSSLAGHATETASATAAQLAVSVHVLGIGAWLGVVSQVWWEARHPALSRLIGAFHRVALLSATTTVLSGVALSLALVPSLDALMASRWGAVLAGKLGLVALVMALGFFHWRTSEVRLARRARDAVRRTLAGESLLALAVIVAAAWLSSTAPPR